MRVMTSLQLQYTACSDLTAFVFMHGLGFEISEVEVLGISIDHCNEVLRIMEIRICGLSRDWYL